MDFMFNVSVAVAERDLCAFCDFAACNLSYFHSSTFAIAF